MELIKVKGPTVKWSDIEAKEEILRLSLTRPRSRAERNSRDEKMNELVTQGAERRLDDIDLQILRVLGFEMQPLRGMVSTPPPENRLVLGAIDFSGSRFEGRKGIWSARRGVDTGEYGTHPEEPTVTVMIRPAGPGDESAEMHHMFPTSSIKILGMRLLGEVPIHDRLDHFDDPDDPDEDL